MTGRRRLPWYCLLPALLALIAPAAHADPVQDLLAAGRLQVDSSLSPTGVLVPGQKATLTLKIATQRWFAGGTRISIPEVPGLVILQTEQFASNASETRDGDSWVVQRWTLDVFPQRAGDFSVPPIRLQVKVNTARDGDVEGELLSPPLTFSAAIPDALAQADSWVAAPAFTVRQSFDRSLEGLQPGDAFEREILFEATDVMAMMLPAVTADKLPGLAAYSSPPVLENSNNRGQSSARRIERISYVVEAAGEYRLPAEEIFWWDTQGQELKLLSLPVTEITVGGAGSADATAGSPIPLRLLLLTALGLLVLGAVAWLLHRLSPRLPAQWLNSRGAALWRQLRDLRRPALPSRLNPDGSAGE